MERAWAAIGRNGNALRFALQSCLDVLGLGHSAISRFERVRNT